MGFIFPKRVLVPYLNIADGFTFGKKRWVILVASKGKFVCLATKSVPCKMDNIIRNYIPWISRQLSAQQPHCVDYVCNCNIELIHGISKGMKGLIHLFQRFPRLRTLYTKLQTLWSTTFKHWSLERCTTSSLSRNFTLGVDTLR